MTNGQGNHDFDFLKADPEEPRDTATDDFLSLSPAEQIVSLNNGLEELRREAAQLREDLQRAKADLANYRKQAEEKRRDIERDANRRLIINLLPAIDELELAINHSGGGEPADSWAGSWVEGVKLIHRKLHGLLEAEGLSKIEAVGVQFDPLQHEAVGMVESAEYPSGYVVEAVRNGYRLRDQVILAAQVVVAR